MTPETIEQFAARVASKINNNRYTPDPFYQTLVDILRDELATRGGSVVEVTAEDVSEADETAEHGPEGCEAMAKCINARLRARASLPAPRPVVDVEVVVSNVMAVTRGRRWSNEAERPDLLREILRRHVTDTGWITVPTTQTSTIKTPEEMGVPFESQIVLQWDEPTPTMTMIRRAEWGGYQTPTRWCVPGEEWHSRSTTPTRAWTAEVCEQFVGKWLMTPAREVYTIKATSADTAQVLNADDVERVYVIPLPESPK